jgi:glycosyltransferase involved in cell wall biosynthesis
MHFWPPRGGQEHLIVSMCNIANQNNIWTIVLQPFKLALLMPSSYKNYKIPSKTIFIPIPTLWVLLVVIKKGLDFTNLKLSKRNIRKIDDLSWTSFNWSLKILEPLFRFFFCRDIKFIHYHFHQKALNIKNTIIFSHGVEWKRPPRTKLDILKIDSLLDSVRSKNTRWIVANDTDYINEIESITNDQTIMNKIILLNNPVNTVLFNPDGISCSQQYQNKRIVMVRNIREDRGIYEGLMAFLIFSNKNKFSDWSLDIYGKFHEDDEYYLKCFNLIKSSSDNKVMFRGPIINREVPEMLRYASISLVPSQELEGTSLAALESMSAGVPCVSTPIGGLRDLPTFKSSGTSPEEIADALLKLCNEYEASRKLQMEITRKNHNLDLWNSKLHLLMSN